MIAWPFDSTLTTDTEGNPIYSRAYSSDVIARVLGKYFRNGIFSDDSSGFQVVENSGLTVDVLPGYCNINGRQGYQEVTQSMTLADADASLPRIDTVVLRLDLGLSARTIGLYVVPGTPASTPAPPALTRNATVSELGLADIAIAANATEVTQADITDTRLDSDRCGVVASIIGDTDTSAYFAQFTALMAEWQENFEAWFVTVQDILGEDEAGNLLNLIQANDSDIAANKTEIIEKTGYGIYSGFEVTAPTGGLGISLDVSGGTCYMPNGDRIESAFGSARSYVDTADGTYPKIDLVYLPAGSTNPSDWSIVSGTPAASPVPPELPSGALLLARVTIPAGASAVTEDDICTWGVRHVGSGRTLVWQNRNPTGSFSAQTLTIDLSSYRYVEIEYSPSTSSSHSGISVTKVPIGAASVLNGAYYYFTERPVSVGSSGIVFSDGKRYDGDYGSSVTTTYLGGCVPLRVWGLK